MLKRFITVNLIFFVTLCLGSALAAPASSVSPADDLEKQLSAFRTYQADFTQSSFQENGRIIPNLLESASYENLVLISPTITRSASRAKSFQIGFGRNVRLICV